MTGDPPSPDRPRLGSTPTRRSEGLVEHIGGTEAGQHVAVQCPGALADRGLGQLLGHGALASRRAATTRVVAARHSAMRQSKEPGPASWGKHSLGE